MILFPTTKFCSFWETCRNISASRESLNRSPLTDSEQEHDRQDRNSRQTRKSDKNAKLQQQQNFSQSQKPKRNVKGRGWALTNEPCETGEHSKTSAATETSE